MRKRYACLLLPLWLAACSGGDTEDLQQWMQNAGMGLRGQVEPLPQVQPYQPFPYQAYDLTDPFNAQKLAMAKRQASANAPDFNRAREALENYDLDKLKLVGILKRGGIRYALVRTPEGAIYRVTAGNFMGQNFGQIKTVDEAELKLSETVEDLNGEWVQRSTSLYLEEQGQNK